MPSDSTARKLLIHACVARTIPGLGKKRFSPYRRIPRSITATSLFGSQSREPETTILQFPVRHPRDFVFTETSPQIRQRLVEDTCTNLLLAWTSFGIAHLVGAIRVLYVTHLDSVLSINRHVLTIDAGLVLIWGVLVTLFQQFFDQTPLAETSSRRWTTTFKAICSTALIVSAGAALLGVSLASPAMFLGVAFLNLGLTTGSLAWTQHLNSKKTSDWNAKNVLIVGGGKLGREIADYLCSNKQQARLFKGFLNENRESDSRVLGKIDELAEVARTEFIDEIIVALPGEEDLARTAIVEAVSNHLDVRIATELLEPYAARAFGPVPIMPLHEERIPRFGLVVKRLMDIAISGVGLLLLAPLLLLIALLIRMDSPGSALYRAPRAGKKGRRFLCCKFRTMHSGADAAREILRVCNERQGATFKMTNDPRITRLGRFLRRYSLDELPQLWNVLVGDMSLVGPRPHPLDDYRRYGLQHLRRLDVTPGITGLWQVTARQDPSFYKNMELDLQYIDQWSLWLDCKILARTFLAVCAGTGV